MREQPPNPTTQRCDGKAAYRSWKSAEKRAEFASARAGALIIAYQCPDCGAFHIGHADLSQRLARQVHIDRGCLQCGGGIHEAQRQKARRWGSPILYCSAACRKLAASQRSTLKDKPQAQE